MNTFVFVIESGIMAALLCARKKAYHFILVEIHSAGIGIGVFVILIKLAAFAAGFMLESVF